MQLVLATMIPETRVDKGNKADGDAWLQSYEQDMEIGYEDGPSPLTLAGLEKKFQDEIVKLLKERNEVEDAEITRHKEVIMEINNKNQEKLSSLRAQEARGREIILQNESEALVHQYQLAGTGQPHTRIGTNDSRGYDEPSISHTYQAHLPGQMNSYVEQPQFPQEDRTRIPCPDGHVYNNAGSRYY